MPNADPDRASRALAREHVPALDGIRALAAFVVVFMHALNTSGGWFFSHRLDTAYYHLGKLGACGVDLFFVLSGFLITGILLDSRGERGYFRSFYARRTLRIFPLYYATLIIAFIVARPFIASADGYQEVLAHQRWYWGDASNWWIVARNGAPRWEWLIHVWSLAVEEQFYLVWPAVVLLLRRRALILLSVAIVLATPALRLWLIARGWDPCALAWSTIARLDALALGAAIAATLRGTTSVQALARRLAPAAAVAAAWIAYAFVRMKADLQDAPLGHTAFAVVFGWLLVQTLVSTQTDGSLARAFSYAPVRWLGQRSYCVYIVNGPIALALNQRLRVGFLPAILNHLLFLAIVLGLCALVAEASWRWFEQPILALKRWFPRSRPAEVPAPPQTAERILPPAA